MEEQNKTKLPSEPTKNKVVQTYAEDMAEVIADGSGGLIKNIIHEEEERAREKELTDPETTRNKIFAGFGTFLLVLSIGLIGYFFIGREAGTVPAQTPFTSIIFNDATAFIEVAELSKDQVIQSIRKEIETKEIKLGGIEGIYLTVNDKIVGLREFVALMKSNFVIYENNYIDDNFLLGFANVGAPSVSETSRDAFLLIQMRSFTDVFQSMKGWETKMFSDLHGLFGIPLSPETAPLITANFENGIIQNKNARILYQTDAEGNKTIVLMYVFVDDTHMVITESEAAVKEVITRLLGNNLKN